MTYYKTGRTAVLFTTHVINERVCSHFIKLRDELPDQYDLLLFYDEQRLSRRAIEKLAGAASLPHDNDDWKRLKRPGRYFPNKIPGNEDGLIMSAMDRLPGYDWYWYIEYDIAFSGHWGRFFHTMESSYADMIAVCMIRHDEIPNWPLWKSLEIPVNFGIPKCEWICAHFPIARFSQRINKILIPVYQHGWSGHAEGLFPTLAKYYGLHLEDIGGSGEFVPPECHNRFYRSTPTSPSLAPGTLVFRPAMEQPGDEPDMLWHPVKTASRHDWDHQPNRFWRLVERGQRILSRLLIQKRG